MVHSVYRLNPGKCVCAHCLQTMQRVYNLGGSISAPGIFFYHSPPVPVLAPPPPHQTIWSTFSPCLRIWPILCTQFMMMARWWLEVVAVTFCVVEFSYFGLCNVLCMEGLRSHAAYLGSSLGKIN